MFKLNIKDFIAEVEAEMAGYEELGKEDIQRWMDNFNSYIGKKVQDKRIDYKGTTPMVKLDDESDLFNIVDRYYAAVMDEDTESYFKDWSL